MVDAVRLKGWNYHVLSMAVTEVSSDLNGMPDRWIAQDVAHEWLDSVRLGLALDSIPAHLPMLTSVLVPGLPSVHPKTLTSDAAIRWGLIRSSVI
jgi:hypothetical protein